MKVVAIDSVTGKEISATIDESNTKFFDFMGAFDYSDEQLLSQIDKMNVSADIKALLYSFSKTTIKAGKVILKIGRKILDILLSIIKAFPNVTFGLIFGWLVGALLSAIPYLGHVLGPLATPIAMAFGSALGAKADLEAGGLGKRIDAVLAEFSPLRA
jgi:hypothetical protein